jgi:uncharacterized membrane-anchored protein
LLFWIIKIAARHSRPRRAADALSMSMNLGYLVATGIFFVIFAVAVAAQIAAKRFHPFLYWTTIIATTTVGTTLADFADRSLGIGYAGGSSILLALLLASLAVWHRTLGSVSVGDREFAARRRCSIGSRSCSRRPWAPRSGTGPPTTQVSVTSEARCFSAYCWRLRPAAYFWTNVSRTTLFWVAFVLTRPLGAVLGDFLDKPLEAGGLALSRYAASAVLLILIIACVRFFPQRAASRSH